MQPRIKNLYWTFTLLFIVPMIASGIGYSAAVAPIVKGMAQLGFPFYLIRFLGAAKLLGAVAILSDKFPRLKSGRMQASRSTWLGLLTATSFPGTVRKL